LSQSVAAAGAGEVPEVRKVTVPTAGMMDQGMLAYVSGIESFVPKDVRDQAWGWVNRLTGLALLRRNEADAIWLDFKTFNDIMLDSIPYWKRTPAIRLAILNAENLVYIQTRRAITISGKSERELQATQYSVGESKSTLINPQAGQRRKFLGLF
jgi:hypothetical protein